MNEPCEKWEDSTVGNTYENFRKFMIKQIIRIEGRKGTLGTSNIPNLVKASTNQANEIVSGELLVQAEEIRALKALIERSSGSDGATSMVNTDTSSVMSSQFQAMKVEIDSLKAAAAATAAATATKSPNPNKKDKKNDGNIAATTCTPYKQRSAPYRIEMKWFLKFCIARFIGSTQWSPGNAT